MGKPNPNILYKNRTIGRKHAQKGHLVMRRKYTEANSHLIREEDLIGPTQIDPQYRELSNQEKSLLLANRVRELVPFRKSGKSWIIDDVPTPESVKILATEVVNMWPRGSDSSTAFSPVSSGHNVIYWGRRYPSGIRRAVTRTSLYADKIYIINPFIDNIIFHPQLSPLIDADKWVAAYASHAAFVSVLHPWIKAGLVEFLPNPGNVNFKLGKALENKAENELIELGSSYEKFVNQYSEALFAENFIYLTDEDREQYLDTLTGVSLADRTRLANIANQLRNRDSDVAKVLQSVRRGMIMRTGWGANFPSIQLMAESLSASIISDDIFNIDRMRLASQKSASSSQFLSDAFHSLDFSFLNDVSTEAAIDVRQMSGFCSFRRYLQDISVLSASASASRDYDNRVKSCADRLADEYDLYKREMKSLDGKLVKDSFLAASITNGIGVLSGKMDAVDIGSNCAIGLIGSLFKLWSGRRAQRGKPLGILMKIEQES